MAASLRLGAVAFPAASGTLAAIFARQQSNAAAGSSSSWEQLKNDGVRVNPCQSPHHPAAIEGVVELEGEELSVQEAYNPDSRCFGCGHAHPDGLHVQSRRIPGEGLGRLAANISFDAKYCAFPGIINGGVLTTAMDCHGKVLAGLGLGASEGAGERARGGVWGADEALVRVLGIKENTSGGPPRATVEVEVVVVQPEQGPQGEEERVLAVGTGIYKRLGALRSL
ncbi:hypothetical protein VOLCADRAFT_99697 [Volvox carteri f. nagariensis]|uniref:Thioesterase domain-containing protein n=1 Tax=Volvox carteri f. nagariensis TaxID=3068 RepID=D8UIE6_VOLCA|nr:uncharacterized protein VOLCADRAFT_99697 [Volvox carteri f. nagariensis]EFJ40497.1 hypothetical protein VOLCADRAFT_99697 [Volvox carteri f. nagariensis]|eukprot:XP_002958421.1 hypothetical protein VOLCADRAFT_99697 [Volvox carteri f. nagariensis]